MKQKKEKRRFKSETVALRNIRRWQNRLNNCILKIAFQRCARKIMHFFNDQYKIQKSTMKTLQDATESFVIFFLFSRYNMHYLIALSFQKWRVLNHDFADSHLLIIHVKRVTIQVKNMRLMKHIMSNLNVSSFEDSNFKSHNQKKTSQTYQKESAWKKKWWIDKWSKCKQVDVADSSYQISIR